MTGGSRDEEPNSTTAPLAGVCVVELATGVAGPYAGRMFGDLGADVVKVEPPGGDPARLQGPFPDDETDPERSALFLYLGANKRSVVATPTRAEDRALVQRLIDRADVVVEGDGDTSLSKWCDGDGGGARAEPSVRWPLLVRVAVTPFGLTGPYAGLAGSELVAYAMGGPMAATGSADREPLKLAGNVIQSQCGAVAALAGLAALTMAERSGRGGIVDVSNFETQAASIDRRTSYLLWHAFTGGVVGRQGGHRTGLIPAGIYPTEDGYVQVLVAPGWLGRLVEMLGDPEVIARFASPDWLDDAELPELLDVALHVWSLGRTKHQAMAEAQARGLGVTAVNSPVDVLTDEQLVARGYWRSVRHPRAGEVTLPGPPFRFGGGGAWSLRRPAPMCDEHGAELRQVLETPPPHAAAGARPIVPAPARHCAACLPLEGIRVLDLTVVWAGPYATMLLGDLGAEVIRVDNPLLFPTATRGVTPRPRPGRVTEAGPIWGAFPHHEPGRRPWNRVGPFVTHARSKLGATLDLRTENGREAFLRLVEQSDALVENNSAKVLDRLGLGWEVLHARNPRLVVVRMPSLGLEGPYAHYIGFGAHVEALCGLTWLRGYPDLDLTENAGTYHMDPASGVAGAFATMAALRRRELSGAGELVELAQNENLLHHLADHLVDAALTGSVRQRNGNRHHAFAPQGVYPCAGEDRWVAITVTDDAAWKALRRAMGEPGRAAHARFDTATGRRLHHDEIDRLLSNWTAPRDRFEVFHGLQAHGVACGPVFDEADLARDPHLAARGFWRANGSIELGQWPFPGHLWKWDGPALRWGPINRMGADNEEVLRGVAGIDDAGWERLAAEGQLSLDYLDAEGVPY